MYGQGNGDVVSDSDVQQAEQMMKAFMPGPITDYFKKETDGARRSHSRIEHGCCAYAGAEGR
jgi:tRNA A37 threonylcarbamoyladenosine synthetase subunit TsaC/SUA5/YrdC